MPRAGVRAVGGGCQTGRSRNYSRIEDQGLKDQQAPLQGDPSKDIWLSGLIRTYLTRNFYELRRLTRFRELSDSVIPFNSAACYWNWTCISICKIFVGIIECSEFTGRKTGKWFLR